MNIKNKNLGFTLVELIVVITILAILGTIAFISIQSYSKSARNSSRVSDVSTLEKGLELFKLDSGKFPLPSNSTEITYGTDIVWHQGTLGEQVIKNIDKINTVPTDPLINKEYTYSVTNSKNEYSIGTILEGDLLGVKLNTKVYAESKNDGYLMIKGNYNGRILKVPKGDNIYILSVPSIISSTGGSLENIITSNQLAYNNFKNLPLNYKGSKFKIKGEEHLKLVDINNLIVYSGSVENLKLDNDEFRQQMVLKINKSYKGTDIKNIGNIKEVVVIDTSNAKEVCELGRLLVNNNAGGKLKIGTNLDSCSGATLPETEGDNGNGGGSNPSETIEIIFINEDNEIYQCELCN